MLLHTMEYYSVINKGKLEPSVGKRVPFNVSEINQTISLNFPWFLLHEKPKAQLKSEIN